MHGPGVFHLAAKAVRSPTDLRGMKVRGPTRPTKLLQSLGATPVGMALPQVPDALSKGTIEGCVLNWEVAPAVKVHELTKHHSEFPTDAPALYTTTFAMTMTKARYDSLPADLKKVIDANSGADLSAWLGKIRQSGDGRGRKLAEDRGNAIHTFSKPETQQFIDASSKIVDEWIADMNKRGFDGKALVASARERIATNGKG